MRRPKTSAAPFGWVGVQAVPLTRFGNDALFGGFLCAIGALGLYLTADLRLGTAMRMGPGYVPMLMAWVCVGFGAVLIGRNLARPSQRPGRWSLRPLLAVLLAVAAFMTVQMTGLVAVVMVVTLIACAGDRETRWGQSLCLAIALSVFCALVFVKGLGLPFPLWPAFLS
jgi:hypothetical protein